MLGKDVWFNALEDKEGIAINTTTFAYYATEYWAEENNCQQWNHFDNEDPSTNNQPEKWQNKLKKHVNHNSFDLKELHKKTQMPASSKSHSFSTWTFYSNKSVNFT